MTLSIIIPVFNSEKYLPSCLESVLSQSFADYELLLIDDGSTDGSGLICDEYAERDRRIRVFHKANGGVSSARNRGLDEANGDFILFIDADDIIGDCHLMHLMDSNADLVLSGMQKFGAKNDKSVPKRFSSFGLEELPLHWNTPPNMNYLYCFPWAKRFRARIIQENGIRFNESLFFSEDMCFNLSYYAHAQTFEELPFADYLYRIESISRNEKYKMSASQLKCHFEYLDTCFRRLYDRVNPGSLSFVRDETSLRMMRKFYYFILQDGLGATAFIDNVKRFRKEVWSGYMLSLLQGKKEKRIMREAVISPFLTYCIEVRLQKAIRHCVKASSNA